MIAGWKRCTKTLPSLAPSTTSPSPRRPRASRVLFRSFAAPSVESAGSLPPSFTFRHASRSLLAVQIWAFLLPEFEDAMRAGWHKDLPFSTYDNDNDIAPANCATQQDSGIRGLQKLHRRTVAASMLLYIADSRTSDHFRQTSENHSHARGTVMLRSDQLRLFVCVCL